MENKLYYHDNLVKENSILSFSGKYFFLNNLYRCIVPYKGLIYGSIEAAYYAQFIKEDYRNVFINIEPCKAKETLDSYFKDDKFEKMCIIDSFTDLMYEIVKSKFDNNSDLKLELLSIDTDLYNTTKADSFWGVVKEGKHLKGDNNLAKILIKIREEYK